MTFASKALPQQINNELRSYSGGRPFNEFFLGPAALFCTSFLLDVPDPQSWRPRVAEKSPNAPLRFLRPPFAASPALLSFILLRQSACRYHREYTNPVASESRSEFVLCLWS